tara:strand:- start:4262 stop:5137 length:876 start_codon:yes stop_codon:yes gene_type:complete
MKVSNIIIITILVLIVVYLITKFLFVTDIIYDILCDASIEAGTNDASGTIESYFVTNKNVISNKDFNDNNTSNFMLSVWFYIDNWGDAISNEKNILYVGANANANTVPALQSDTIGMSTKTRATSTTATPLKNINIGLDKYENNLFIDIETYPDTPPAATGDGNTIYTRYLIKNIPVQKWNCLILSVDTKTLDVYLDGKLRNSFILHGVYKNVPDDGKRKNIYIGNLGNPNTGFQGFITRIRYQPNAINPQEAYNIYKKGINASLAKTLYNKYGLKVSFTEYNKERASFNI